MASSDEKEEHNLADTEIEVLVSEVKKNKLLGGLVSDITNNENTLSDNVLLLLLIQ